ncbi:MAG: hypothetical protein V4456_11585 [Bacteroidota bacterium]
MEIAYFKREQRPGVFHFYKVYGGPGKTKDGYQEVINFLNEKPIISVEHNLPFDRNKPDEPFELTGTWCQYEVGVPISEAEYLEAYKKATTDDFALK